ncbi:hypothetical protein ACIOHS_27025 [Streptomyces sp. NPDC088253]|uniref:hypothetical protein n=1 Tax=Streptomyces sp. NPDC088253 TaxID=3365846 RepID=UPI0038038810
MYDVTIEFPGMDAREYVCNGPGELRSLVWDVARAQGKPITDEDGRDLEMIFEVGDLRSRADIEGVGLLDVHAVKVQVKPVEDEFAYACDGHEGEDIALLGGPTHCDGSCKPRRRWNREALVDLTCALDDAEVEADGGCGRCSLEAAQMCAACGRCNCHDHSTCVRPVGK